MNPYSTLEVDPKASQVVIEAAYRTLAKEHYTDDKRMRLLNAAKEILFNPDKKAEFDNKKDLRKGKVVGDYTILEKIAEGGFGITYLAEHNRLKAKVCIKHALNISAIDEQLLFEEANSIWDLRHYAIPAIRDVLKFPDGSVALVMSYVAGPTLAQILERRKRLDAEHVSWITSRVLNALKYLHFNGVIHGDIKPQNIIVQPDSHNVVLVDYGLASIRPKRDTANKGYTPLFAAPEQIDGKPLVPETDFYGLGVTMIYSLGGDVEHRKVPDDLPDAICAFIKRLIPIQVLSRPSWNKEDLCETFVEVRDKAFGRKMSNMKELKF